MAATVTHRRGERVRQAILAAALDVLAEQGVAAATVAAVARRAAVHETTIYRRWSTKENLFVEAMLRRSADAIPAPDSGWIRDDLLAIVRAVHAYITSPGGRAVLHTALLCVDDAYSEERRAFWSARLEALRQVVERAIDRGQLRAGIDPRLLLETVVAPLHVRVLLTGEPIDDDLPERIVDLVLEGAAAHRAALSASR
jgi:AcrR family transcriptional regulator